MPMTNNKSKAEMEECHAFTTASEILAQQRTDDPYQLLLFTVHATILRVAIKGQTCTIVSGFPEDQSDELVTFLTARGYHCKLATDAKGEQAIFISWYQEDKTTTA